MSNGNGNSTASQPQAAPATGLNLDDLLAAQQTALKAVSELRSVVAEQDALRTELARLQQEHAALVTAAAQTSPAPEVPPKAEIA